MRTRRTVAGFVIVGATGLGVFTGVPPIQTQGIDVWRPAIPGDSVPLSIADAERQGNEYPRSASHAAFPKRFQDMVGVGTAHRHCVVVGNAVAAHSGDFIGVGFRNYADEWRRGSSSKMTWASAHRVRAGESLQLTIKASRAGSPAESHVFAGQANTYRWPAAVLASVLMRSGWARGAEIPLPSAGRWLLVASVANDWGCFVLDLP